MFPPKLQVGQQLAKLVNWEGSMKVELEAGENHARGGANSLLWISEWGVIQFDGLGEE